MSLPAELLAASAAEFLASPKNVLARNVVSQLPLTDVSISLPSRMAHASAELFSCKVKIEGKASNQASTGRCWMFAALNCSRLAYMKKYNLPADFELSQSYLFFYDKVERINWFLREIVDTAEEEVSSRVVQVRRRDGEGEKHRVHAVVVVLQWLCCSGCAAVVCCSGVQ